MGRDHAPGSLPPRALLPSRHAHYDVRVSRYPSLEARYGPLTPFDQGADGRVYAAGEVVVKVFREHSGEHRLEAANMRRAGFGDGIVEVCECDGADVLVMRRFDGTPPGAQDVPRVVAPVGVFLRALHAQRDDTVDLERLRARLRRFRSALAAYPLGALFVAVEEPLERGELAVPAAFCHLDLWADNILLNRRTGEVKVIDWTRAHLDDPIRDLALFKTGTLDLLPDHEALALALSLLPDEPFALTRLRAYLAHTYLHDFYWFLMNEPYAFEAAYAEKLPRARQALTRLPASDSARSG